MRVYSWNVNGIRALHRKNCLHSFIDAHAPDALFFQEIKGREDQFPEGLLHESYDCFFHPAQKPGYAGVAMWVRKELRSIEQTCARGIPAFDDSEGRVLSWTLAHQPQPIVFISVYAPNGGKSEQAYREKLKFFEIFGNYVVQLKRQGMQVLAGGDFNVARSELDLAEPEKHRTHTHFCDEVRSSIESMLTAAGLVDTYRSRNPTEAGSYTYWDNFDFSLPRGVTPRSVNKGWRLDYFFATEELDATITQTEIHSAALGSDHCPISVTVT